MSIGWLSGLLERQQGARLEHGLHSNVYIRRAAGTMVPRAEPRFFVRALVPLGVLVALNACTAGPDYARPEPPATPAQVAGAMPARTVSTPRPGGEQQVFLPGQDLPRGVVTANIYTQIGLLALIGSIIRHGILLVEFANDVQRDEGVNRREAMQQAASLRFRSIMMTTIATLVGMIPLLMSGSGPGANSRFAISFVLGVGMTIGTVFTLFVVPAVYTLVATKRDRSAPERNKANRRGHAISEGRPQEQGGG